MVELGERAQGLREPDALREDLTLVPSIHSAAHNCVWYQFQRIRCPFLATIAWALSKQVVHIYSCR